MPPFPITTAERILLLRLRSAGQGVFLVVVEKSNPFEVVMLTTGKREDLSKSS